jgi:hypothetical protein
MARMEERPNSFNSGKEDKNNDSWQKYKRMTTSG